MLSAPERKHFPITPYCMCAGLAVAELRLYRAFLHQGALCIILFFALGAKYMQRGLVRRESEQAELESGQTEPRTSEGPVGRMLQLFVPK